MAASEDLAIYNKAKACTNAYYVWIGLGLLMEIGHDRQCIAPCVVAKDIEPSSGVGVVLHVDWTTAARLNH